MKEGYRPVGRDALDADVEQELWKARKLLPRKVEPGNFSPYRAAHAVAEHHERSGITRYSKPPLPLHGNPHGAACADGTESETPE